MGDTILQDILDRLHQDPTLELQAKAALAASLSALGLPADDADVLASVFFSWLEEEGGKVATMGLSTPLTPPDRVTPKKPAKKPARKPAKKPAKKPARAPAKQAAKGKQRR